MNAQGGLNRFHQLSNDQSTWVSATEWLAAPVANAATPPPVPGHRSDNHNKATKTATPPQPVSPEKPADGHGDYPKPPDPLQGAESIRIRSVLLPFPCVVLLAMHFFTFGIFTFFWVTGMHGKLPKRFPNDLSGRKAIARMCTPLFNLYSAFVVYGGLCDRLNEILSQYGLRGKMSNALAVTMCIFLVGPALSALAGIAVLVLLYLKNQDAYNQAISAEHTILGQLTAIAYYPENYQAILLFFAMPTVFLLLDYFFLIPVFALSAQEKYNRIGMTQIERLLAK